MEYAHSCLPSSQVAVGEEVMVVGNAPEMGEWDYQKGVKLEWHPGHVWRGSVSVADAVIQYKFVKVPEDLAVAEWEDGDDRTANLNEISSPGISITSCWGQPESYHSATPLQVSPVSAHMFEFFRATHDPTSMIKRNAEFGAE